MEVAGNPQSAPAREPELERPVPAVGRPLGAGALPTGDRFRWMVESVREVIFEADPQGNWTYLNPAWTRILGYPVEECIGRGFLEFVHPADRQRNLEIFIATVMGGKDRCRLEARYIAADGAARTMEIHAWIFRSPDGEPLGSTGTLTDVSERRLAEEELERRATHDPLTGLPNRALLCERLADGLLQARNEGRGAALLFLDLDRFKVVNDTLGHDAGDAVLRAVADRLRQSARPGDTVARFGGDEFVVLCEDIDGDAARAVSRDLRAAIATPLWAGERDFRLTASVGLRVVSSSEIAEVAPDDLGALAKTVLRDADSAMYEGKQSGRDRTELFDIATRRRIIARHDTETRLRRALDEDALVLHYQPQISVTSGEVVGYEALLRWRDPDVGLVPPAAFISVAEESGLIAPIGRWVLDEVCRLLADADELSSHISDPAPRLTVNVSAHQFTAGLVTDVAGALSRSGAAPSRLCLELTESALLADTQTARETMFALADLGITLSLDDFGTGFSSLAYLQRLPLHELKIDRTFVAQLGELSGRAIVAAIIGLTEALGLHSCAEGVEHPEQLRILAELGCDAAQGYWIARPARFAEAIVSTRQLVIENLSVRRRSRASRSRTPLPARLVAGA